MNKKLFIFIGISSVVIIFLIAVIARRPSVKGPESFGDKQSEMGRQMPRNSKGSCLGEDCLAVSNLEYPVSELPEDVIQALDKAIDDEYKAYSTYDAVIEKFGNVRPFIMIIRAEEQHISSLKAIYDKYGIEIPDNQYLGQLASPETIEEACSIGVQAEIDNAALYKDELLPAVVEYEDITLVFNNLINASQTKHLPAFEKCSN